MVYLEPANNSQYKEQTTILLLKCGLFEGSPRGAGCVVITAPALDIPSARPPLVAATLPENGSSTLAFPGPLLNPVPEQSTRGACGVLGLRVRPLFLNQMNLALD